MTDDLAQGKEAADAAVAYGRWIDSLPKPEPTSTYAQRAKPATDEQKERLEDLRIVLKHENISMGELYELQTMAAEGVIDPSDTEMLEAAGVSEWEATGYGEGNPEDIEGNDL